MTIERLLERFTQHLHLVPRPTPTTPLHVWIWIDTYLLMCFWIGDPTIPALLFFPLFAPDSTIFHTGLWAVCVICHDLSPLYLFLFVSGSGSDNEMELCRIVFVLQNSGPFAGHEDTASCCILWLRVVIELKQQSNLYKNENITLFTMGREWKVICC